MLNRRTEVPVSRALEPLKGASGRSDPVFAGGPVELANVLALLRTNVMPEGAEHVTGKVYLVPTGELLEKTLAKRPDPADFRVYLGYCGWAPGQLENETSHGFWRVLNGSADIMFDSEPETLWSRLIERAEQRIARATGSRRESGAGLRRQSFNRRDVRNQLRRQPVPFRKVSRAVIGDPNFSVGVFAAVFPHQDLERQIEGAAGRGQHQRSPGLGIAEDQ